MMITRSLQRVAAGCASLLVLGLFASPTAAEQSAGRAAADDSPEVAPEAAPEVVPEVASGFFDTIDVEIVNVEVYVTDRDDNPVTGLTRDDFRVELDGEEMPISNFFAATAEARRDETIAQDVLPETMPGSRASSLELEPVKESAQQLHLVLFIDNQNISPKNRNRALAALRDSVLETVSPGDRVTLVNYAGSLEILQQSTDDPQALAATLDALAETSPTGMHTQLERVSILRSMQEGDLDSTAALLGSGGTGNSIASSNQDWGSVLNAIRNYMREEHSRTVRTIDTLGRFVDALAALDGRKALVYVSDGLPLRPGEALLEAFSQKASVTDIGVFNPRTETREFDATHRFEALGKRANASRVTFYTILAAGGSPHTVTMAEQSAFVATGNSGNQLGRVWDSRLESIENSNFRGSMQILAESTGGLATLSSRDFGRAIGRIQSDLGTYYSLAFEAPDAAEEDDKARDHRIEVEVEGDGLRVRHRETYRLRTAEERMEVQTQSALLFAGGPNPLGVKIDFAPAKEDEDGNFLVPVIVKFPLAGVVLAPGEKAHEGRVSIYVGARSSEDGGLSPVQRMPAPIRIPNDQVMTALSQVAGYRMMLLVAPGRHRVAVSVRDEIAQVESTAVVDYEATPAVARLEPGADGAAVAKAAD